MMQKLMPLMTPSPGGRLQRFVGDWVRFTLSNQGGGAVPGSWRACLRTNLGRAGVLRKEIIQAHARKMPPAGASWRDLSMRRESENWTLDLPLTEPGWFRAKAYFLDPEGWQHWPDGPDVGISVHPDSLRTANTIYCAFVRMFGPNQHAKSTVSKKLDHQFEVLDKQGYTVIPPSGKFRDLIRELPHIIDTLGCRILHLLPVNPVPTSYARFGRFGSPYASLDLTAVDPALVEFDKRTTGIDQFRELAHATHLKGARLFLDIVINHTGWGSWLQENHPEWFQRGKDNAFVSPGAWGVTWEDLVELDHELGHGHVDLWDAIAEALLVWCRRGVDGFRCDAGHMVPVSAWEYIIARVRDEFPETIFLLEGLGGSWETTQNLLTIGGMQWAYSELFQNYSAVQVSGYLDHSLKQSQQTGLLVHYSETHDNDRLAQRGRVWSLLRNQLCALASVSGGYGFTCGVEWLAAEKFNVHSSRGLAWGNTDNLIPELTRLNHLLAEHPCFFDGAKLARLSAPDSPIYALRRDSAEGNDSVLVLVNTDPDKPQKLTLAPDVLADGKTFLQCELLGQLVPMAKVFKSGGLEFTLDPGACYCLSPHATPQGLSGENYRRARAQAAWATTALGHVLPTERIPATPWQELAKSVDADPTAFLASISAPGGYPPVVTWNLPDARRILPVPPGHWLLIRDTVPFRATLGSLHANSIPVRDGHVACFAPGLSTGDALLTLERCIDTQHEVKATVRILAPGPDLSCLGQITHNGDPLEQALVLLTNGIGGMARLCVDLGTVKSKYDCLLGASLHPRLPVDRHIFAKRVRVWINAGGFISPLDTGNLAAFEPGPPANWRFVANAGDGRTVEIQLTAAMLPGRNTTVLHFSRPATRDACDVRLTVRVDIEDRNFHAETKRNGGADYHFSTNTHLLDRQVGFAFTPAVDRQLRVYATGGSYHPQPEWSENLPHPIEASRGQVGSGDAYSPGWFDLPLAQGENISVVACADASGPTKSEIQNSVGRTAKPGDEDTFSRQLQRAARAFVVRRDDGVTVIAGYPWFLDWGRDSLICARGLLAAGMVDQVKQLLVVFGRFARNGTLPNTIHGDDASNRDTSDAPLWYGVVCEETAALLGKNLYATKVDTLGNTIASVLSGIAAGYINGTPNGIRMDPQSALIWSPSHFTWMDTNYPAGTPREGYPVEIQVLWIRLLQQLARIAKPAERERWHDLAEQAQVSLQKWFWLEDRGWFSDVLLAKPGQGAAEAVADSALRSNCLFAISLGLVTGVPAQRCVAAALRHLVVPGALRTLAPLPVAPPLPIRGARGQLLNNPVEPYWGHYEGDEDTRRKPAYHNGTAWTWTFPVFCEALARAWNSSPEAVAAAKAYLGSMDHLMVEGCLGQLPEIIDGDAPHRQRGCDAQAWGVTEALRVWKLLQSACAEGAKR